MRGSQLSYVVGAGFYRFELTSECVDGKRASVDILGVGAVTGFGAMLGIDIGEITFEDGLDALTPGIFNGYFGYSSAMLTPTIGIGAYAIGLGGNGSITSAKASSFGAGLNFGFGIGATTLAGSSTVIAIEYEGCSCQ